MITENEIKELVNFAKQDERFGVAFYGALSQIRHKVYLESCGFTVKVSDSDNFGAPDFVVNGKTMEHKKARNKTLSDGTLIAEFQKSRGKVPDRLYNSDFSDFVSVDVSEHTKKKNDYRYARVSDLKEHHKHKGKISSTQKINSAWVSDLKILLEKAA